MPRDTMSDLVAFLAVARERSFTRAAGQLGVSPSALSHTIRGLEERLGVRLLTRTTRSVSPTDAGERLLRTAGPLFDEVRAELEALSEYRDKPAGTIRIVAGDHPAETVLWPAIEKLLPDYPDISVEVCIDNAFGDIVAERFDAGVRLGEAVAKDMIAVRIGPELRWLAVASPEYLSTRPVPSRRIILPSRYASTSACPHWEASGRGSSKRTAASLRSASRASSLSTASI
jgi:DNA-binding transcriptional LysR family regulator